MPMIEAIEATELSDFPLFAGLRPEELQHDAELIRRTTVPAGTILITSELAGEAIYFIVEGSARVQVLRESGVELTLALLGPGDIVGEMSLITGRGRSSWVSTRKETTLLWMERKVFWRLLERSPQLSHNLIVELIARLRAAHDRELAITTLDVTGRVARLILDLAERYGRPVPGEGIHIAFPVTQGEVAEMIAATRERVNQIMVHLKRSGVFAIDSEWRITVLRPDILADLSRA